MNGGNMSIWSESRNTIPAIFKYKNRGHAVTSATRSLRQAAEILRAGAEFPRPADRLICIRVQPPCICTQPRFGRALPFCRPAQASCSPAQTLCIPVWPSCRRAQLSGRLTSASAMAKLRQNKIVRGFIMPPIIHNYTHGRTRISLLPRPFHRSASAAL